MIPFNNRIEGIVTIGLSDWECNECNYVNQEPQPELSFFGMKRFADWYHFDDDRNIESILRAHEPDLILTIGGEKDRFVHLNKLTDTIKRKWVHLSDRDWWAWIVDIDKSLPDKLNDKWWKEMLESDDSLVSIMTTAYKIGDKIHRTYDSIKNQSYKNWQWVINDDSPDRDTWKELEMIASNDNRVKIIRNEGRSPVSRIGRNNFLAATQCDGKYLVELDHDDSLTTNCVEDLIYPFKEFDDVGMTWGDSCGYNVVDNTCNDWGPWYAGRYGHRYWTTYPRGYGKKWKVMRSANINPFTIRRLWSTMNIPKCWKKDVYFDVGGHNTKVNVTDDYDLILRMFLGTRIARVQKLCIFQNDDGTKDSIGGHIRHKSIQRAMRHQQRYYECRIHERFEELGIDDWCWNKEKNESEYDMWLTKPGGERPAETPDMVANYISELKEPYEEMIDWETPSDDCPPIECEKNKKNS